MRCLVTGITGFVGRHLTTYLHACGHEVSGLVRPTSDTRGLNVPLYVVDFLDCETLASILNSVQPEWVFHLAGFASPGASFKNPGAAWQTNFTITQVLFDALALSTQRPRVLSVSSGLVYGDPLTPGHAFTETDELRPASPYAASKAAADLLAFQQTRNPGLDIVRVRPFNHIGPGHAAEFVASSFAKQLAAIQLGQAPPLMRTGALTSQRDFTDVRDMVRAYVRLLEVGMSGEAYNAGSGRVWSIRALLDELIALAGVPVEVHEQADPTRAGDTAISMANATKLRTATGWQPELDLRQTLADLLADWRTRFA